MLLPIPIGIAMFVFTASYTGVLVRSAVGIAGSMGHVLGLRVTPLACPAK
ncbi:MAG TPA: hypothetical protein VNE42_07575 [Acidimicrobiales bacterium]|nr:hypothetical protein [Acidimicrobiales bacterium]